MMQWKDIYAKRLDCLAGSGIVQMLAFFQYPALVASVGSQANSQWVAVYIWAEINQVYCLLLKYETGLNMLRGYFSSLHLLGLHS